MARRRNSSRRRRGSFSFLYKLLSVLVICGAIVLALTLFFKVDVIEISGQQRYTEEEIRAATGIELGDNLFLLNKFEIAGNMVHKLPYIEEIHIDRRLPETLKIEIQECKKPLAVLQEGKTWLVSPSGKIVECTAPEAAKDYAMISGCALLSPTVGEPIGFPIEFEKEKRNLLNLLSELNKADMLDELNGVRLSNREYLCMDYMDRFSVRIPYDADFEYKLRFLQAVIADEKIQDNMTGTFDMRSDDGRVNFIQNVR